MRKCANSFVGAAALASILVLTACDPYAKAPATPVADNNNSGGASGGGGGSVVHASDTTFKAEVLDHQGVVLVDFWAPWCGPCKIIAPTIDQLAVDYSGRAKIVKLDTDQAPKTASSFNIRGIPLVMVFKNGKKEKEILGAQDRSAYVAALDAALK